MKYKTIAKERRQLIKRFSAGPGCLLCRGAKLPDLIHQTKDFIIVLDAYPACTGHVILAPKRHIKTLSQLTNSQAKAFILLAKRLDRALHKIFHPFKIDVVSASAFVPHFHFHIIPIPNEEMMWDFKYLRKDKIIKYSPAEKAKIIKKIKSFL